MHLFMQFRFHTGSIKSFSNKVVCRILKGFDSILVRLKVECIDVHAMRITVSIPYWFD